MRTISLSLSFLFTLVIVVPALTAQTSTTPASFTIISGQGCPVTVSAQRRAPYTMVETGKTTPGPNHGYLYLHFAPAVSAGKQPSLVAATVVLHGTDNTPRAELAATDHAADLTESFKLREGAAGPLRDSQVSPGAVINVRWLSIAELRYADGSVWHPSDRSFCHVTPGGFELVNATAK